MTEQGDQGQGAAPITTIGGIYFPPPPKPPRTPPTPPPPKPPIKPPPPKPPPKKPPPKVPPKLIIERTPYPKWWKDARAYMISMVGPETRVQIAPTPGYRTYISTIAFTVTDETNVVLNMGVFGPSGPMHFGGDGGPRGIVMAMGDSPMPCGGGGFSITIDGAGVSLAGFICYYYEPETIKATTG